MPLVPEELELLRTDLVEWFTDTCDIYRVVGLDDVYGGRSSDHGIAIATDVPCKVESGAGQDQERLLAGQITEIQVFTVRVPVETDVEVDDHIVIKTPENLHLYVRAVMAPETIDIEKRLIATQIGQENVGP